MPLQEAVQIARRKFWGGWAIVGVGSFLLLLCMLKTLYHATSNVAIHNWIVDAYEAIPLFDVFWPYLPLPSTSPLLSAENFKFAGVLSILGCGTLLRNSGYDLSQRIATARKNAKAKGWERSWAGEVPRPDVLALQIEVTNKDKWYKRPLGIVLLAIISGSILILIRDLFNLPG